MKKWLLVVLSLALALAGAPGALAEQEEPLEFTLLHRYISEGNGNMDYNEGNPVTEYMEEMTGIHINWQYLPATDALTKLNTMIAGGDYPDAIFDAGGVGITNDLLQEWGEEGIIATLEDLIPQYMPNFNAILQEREDIRSAVTSPEGHIYSLARTDGGIHVLVNNKLYVYGPWYEAYLAAGNGEVVTTEDYRHMLQYFKDNDMNGNGDPSDEIPLSGNGSAVQNLVCPFAYYNGGLYLEDGVVTASFTSEGFREGLRYVKELWDAGLIDSEMFTQDTSQISALVNREAETDRIVGGFSSLWDGSYVNASIVPYDTYVAIGPLEGPDGTRQCVYSLSDINLGVGIFFSGCENLPALLEWFDYFYSYEGTMLMAYGLEGISWNWSDTPSISGEERSVERTMPGSTLYEHNLQWLPNAPCYRTPEIKYIESAVAGGSGIDLYNSSMQYLPYADESKAISPLLWMTPEQSEEMALYKADIDTYVNEMVTAFITGSRSLDDDWEDYLSTLEAMDLQGYIELQQEIVDADV